MRIAEIFRSFQGEGRLTGVESIFVRVSGCNLRCRYCDTPYASWTPEGEDLSVEEILTRIERLDRHSAAPAATAAAWSDSVAPQEMVSHVVLTGGEPLLFDDLSLLCSQLRRQGRHVTVETAGTVFLPIECDLMSISPKLGNSTPPAAVDPNWTRRHESSRFAPEVIGRMVVDYEYQVKFVVDTPADCEEVEAYLAQFPAIDRRRVMLMPQGRKIADLTQKAAWMEPYCLEHGMQFCPRRHVEWFGGARGT